VSRDDGGDGDPFRRGPPARNPARAGGLRIFYRRHGHAIAGYFLRRTGSPELTADLTAETFAAALRGARRFDPARGPAVGWLYGIARRELGDALQRGRVEDRARRRLRIPRIDLDDEALERVEAAAAAAGSGVLSHLEDLPAEQRDAVRARVVDERDYADIAVSALTSEPVIRQRVSRGLAALRSRLREDPMP